MSRYLKFKLVSIAVLVTASSACAQPTSTHTADITAESLLKILVQIATQEDLSDEKRIGELLKIDIELIPEEPRVRSDGQISVGAGAKEPSKPNYLWPGHSSFDYRRWIAPKRSGILSLVLNAPKTCISVQELSSAFIQHGTLNQRAQSLPPPPPPGTFYAPVVKQQPIYAYAFQGKKTSASFTFRFTNCLVDIQLVQPAQTN